MRVGYRIGAQHLVPSSRQRLPQNIDNKPVECKIKSNYSNVISTSNCFFPPCRVSSICHWRVRRGLFQVIIQRGASRRKIYEHPNNNSGIIVREDQAGRDQGNVLEASSGLDVQVPTCTLVSAAPNFAK